MNGGDSPRLGKKSVRSVDAGSERAFGGTFAFSLFLVSQRRWKCFCKVKYVQILSCFKITGQTIMINIAGKTNQYPQFFDRLAITFVVSREDELNGNDGVLRRINIFHLFT